jgi:hypothetical protein
MTLRFPVVLAVAFVAMAGTAPLTQQADNAVDSGPLSNVRRIRARIEERARQAASGPSKA